LMSTLSTFEMWLHHHTEDRVIKTVNTDNVQETARYSNLFAVQRQLSYSQVREGFQDMADVEISFIPFHLSRILRTEITEREDSVMIMLKE
jgi:hypothetical protein